MINNKNQGHQQAVYLRFVRTMKERAGTGEIKVDNEPTIPNLVTRMARGSGAEHERVAGGPMSNILEAWRMYRSSVGQKYSNR